MAPSVALPVPIAPPRLRCASLFCCIYKVLSSFTLLCRIQEQPEEKPLPPRPQDSFLDLSPESSPTLPHTNSPRPPDNEGKHVSFADPPNFSYGSGKITRPYSHGPGTTTHPYSPTLVGSDRPFSFGSSANPPFVDPSPPQSPPQSHAPAPAPADPAKPKPSDTKPPPMGPVSKAVFAEGVKSFLSVGMATIAIAGGNALIGQPQPP
jgi:hypothetical protein